MLTNSSRPKSPQIVEKVDATINSVVNPSEPLFQPFPPEIIFKGYQPYESYEVNLTLRNNDKVNLSIHPSIYLSNLTTSSLFYSHVSLYPNDRLPERYPLFPPILPSLP